MRIRWEQMMQSFYLTASLQEQTCLQHLMHYLRELLRSEIIDLIICGKQTTDGDTAQVGPAIAEHLGIPHAAWVSEIVDADSESIQVKQDLVSVSQTSKIPYPCLITVDKDMCVPRLPSYLLQKQSKDRPVKIMTFEDMADQNLSNMDLSDHQPQ